MKKRLLQALVMLVAITTAASLMLVGSSTQAAGLPAKGYTDITVAQLKELMASNKDLVIVDVREPSEYSGGHIAGAWLIPSGTVAARAADIPRDVPVALICRGGNRSSQAASTLAKLGFTNLLNVLGGMNAWDGPVEYGLPKAPAAQPAQPAAPAQPTL